MSLKPQNASTGLTAQPKSTARQQEPAASLSLGEPEFDPVLHEQAKAAGVTNSITAAFTEASDAQPYTREASTAFEDENTSDRKSKSPLGFSL